MKWGESNNAGFSEVDSDFQTVHLSCVDSKLPKTDSVQLGHRLGKFDISSLTGYFDHPFFFIVSRVLPQ
jgi:hypothetical protein